MELFVLVVVILGVSSAASDAKNPVEPGTAKIPNPQNGLFLSYPEIKLFNGHSVNLLRSWCPNVDSEHLHKFQRFITYRSSASTHEVPHKKKAFTMLLDSLRKCSSNSSRLKTPFFGVNMSQWIQQVRFRVDDLWTRIMSFFQEAFPSEKRHSKKKEKASQPTTTEKPTVTALSGGKPFEKFNDLMANLYKKACHAKPDMQQLFSGASKDFLAYVSGDARTLQKAGDFFLHDGVIKNMTECITKLV